MVMDGWAISPTVSHHAASGWRIHCGVEVTELSTNKQHTLSHQQLPPLTSDAHGFDGTAGWSCEGTHDDTGFLYVFFHSVDIQYRDTFVLLQVAEKRMEVYCNTPREAQKIKTPMPALPTRCTIVSAARCTMAKMRKRVYVQSTAL
jgi:hypothetical protein